MSALLSLVVTNAALAGLLALVACAAGRLVKRQSIVHALWLLALVKLVTPPLLTLPCLPEWRDTLLASPAPTVARMPAARLARTARADAGHAPADDVPLPPSTPLRSTPGAWTAAPGPEAARFAWPAATQLAGILLALGASALSLLTALRHARFHRLLAGSQAAPPGLAARAEALARLLGLRAAPRVVLVPAPIPPMLWPTLRGPRLLLARDLVPELAGDECDALLAHELAHVRRRDHWVRFVEIAATALFWWYPVLWWARDALRRAEERCCDEWVLRVLPASAGAYASGLLKSVAFVSGEPHPLPIGASGAGPVQDLEARLKEILMTRPLPQLAAPARLALAVTALAGLAVFPTHAQSVPGAAATVATEATASQPAIASHPRSADARRTPKATAVRTGVSADVVSGVPGGVAGGVVGGVPGGVAGGVQGAVGELADDVRSTDPPEDPALTAERHALDEQRRKLREQEIEIERQTLELESRATQKRLSAEAAEARAEGRAGDAARTEKELRLDAKRVEFQKQQLQLELERGHLEAELERAAAGSLGPDAERLAAELERNQKQLDERQEALQAQLEKADAEQAALDAEGRIDELQRSTGDIERSLSEHLVELRSALPEAGARKGDIERDIRRLESALDALARPSTGAPQRMKTRRPQP